MGRVGALAVGALVPKLEYKLGSSIRAPSGSASLCLRLGCKQRADLVACAERAGHPVAVPTTIY